jgi:DUF971 family protein
MAEQDPESIRPAEIVLDPEAGLLRIEWRDGHQSLYELAALRPRCPCAMCQGERGMPGVVREDTVFTAEQTTLVDLREVGRYALQPVWADGHDTGFFTFRLLRALCPCPIRTDPT